MRRTKKLNPNSLRILLDELLRTYHRKEWISSDPVQFAHRFAKKQDQELAAFLSALFAYGSARLIIRAVEQVLKPMGDRPYEFLLNWDGSNKWEGFYYRFHHERHLLIVLQIVQIIIRVHGSFSNFFKHLNLNRASSVPLENILNGTSSWFHQTIRSELASSKQQDLWPGLRFLFNSPNTGSACKRHLMFFRWMVRKDEIDLGLWDWLTPADLIIPVDTHIARMSHRLGLRTGLEKRAPSWRMANEITAALRKIDGADPIHYDFAITRLGMQLNHNLAGQNHAETTSVLL